MSLAVDLRLRCDEACEDGGAVGDERTEKEESDPIEDSGEKDRKGSGGVEGMDFKVGSKGELDGELGKRVSLIGKVNARGVGEMMETVGGGGASVDTSRAIGARDGGANGARGEYGAAGSARVREDGEDLLRAEASRVR